MSRIYGRFLALILMMGAFLVVTTCDSQADSQNDYDRGGLGVKGIFFLPDLKSDGLNGAELFVCGYRRPWAMEPALGWYSSKSDNDLYDSFDTLYVRMTAKYFVPLGPARFFMGIGIGLYYGEFSSDDDGVENVSGLASGFHFVGGAEISVGRVSVRGELLWSSAEVKPGDDIGDLDVGGVMANVGIGLW